MLRKSSKLKVITTAKEHREICAKAHQPSIIDIITLFATYKLKILTNLIFNVLKGIKLLNNKIEQELDTKVNNIKKELTTINLQLIRYIRSKEKEALTIN